MPHRAQARAAAILWAAECADGNLPNKMITGPTLLPSRAEFRGLAASHNVIAVYVDLVAEGETPVSAFQKLDAEKSFSFLFESAEQNERTGRFSFLGLKPRLVFQATGSTVSLTEQDRTRTFETTRDPLAELEAVMERFRFVSPPALPRFAGGAVGVLGYDVARYFEPTVPPAGRDELRLPEMIFVIMGTLLIFDHRLRRLQVVVNTFVEPADEPDRAYDSAQTEIRHTLDRLSVPSLPLHLDAQRKPAPVHTRGNMSRHAFEALVTKAKEFIVQGDIFQVVLSQRFEADFTGQPLDLYRCLRLINPSPYMFCLCFGGMFSLVGSSPEMHVRLADGVVQLRPIAGTRRRGKTPEEDERNAAELLSDPKERAEHVMLVDLARNDIGRIAEFGSVRVTEEMTIERYSHVMHIVSHVTGRLNAGKNAYDVMRATFPAGTVSGAPKVRAMQIISELEHSKRGCYAGAVGYFGFDGALDCCIALRSVVLKDGRAYVQAGAGIVADSDPAAEYRETVSKAAAVVEAIALAAEMSGVEP